MASPLLAVKCLSDRISGHHLAFRSVGMRFLWRWANCQSAQSDRSAQDFLQHVIKEAAEWRQWKSAIALIASRWRRGRRSVLRTPAGARLLKDPCCHLPRAGFAGLKDQIRRQAFRATAKSDKIPSCSAKTWKLSFMIGWGIRERTFCIKNSLSLCASRDSTFICIHHLHWVAGSIGQRFVIRAE